MKEILFLTENLSAKDRVNLAIDQVNGLTREIADQMGDQWERDRFGRYKSEHMINMANNSQEIIKNYELDKDEELVQYLPLFKFICQSHDLGRHFHDNDRYVDDNGKFMDHGEISIRLLEEKGILKKFFDDEQKVIGYTIRNHSLKEMMEPVDDVERKAQIFCTVFRDIDKLEVLNKRDFVKAREIYRLLGIHFDLDEYKNEWKTTEKKEDYIELIQQLLDEKELEINDGLGEKIKEIVDGQMQENIGEINIIECFESGKSTPMNVYRETKSYANYLLFLLSYLNNIQYDRTVNEVDQKEIQEKMNFLKNKTTEEQYSRIRAVLNNKYKYEII
ncbi:MAG: hypothetical protein PHD49_00520 [Candidatus Shapirobacteria bacterium]|nr:hypothetical protein [Candidatus Shapirobacteria bacterium]